MRNKYVVYLILLLGLSSCGNDRDTQKQRFLIRGNEALSQQNYREATRFYNEALKIDSCYSPAWNNLGVTRFEQKQYGKALEAYDAALACNPEDVEAILNRTNAYYETNQLYRAEDDIAYLIRNMPDSSELHFRLGLVHAKMHKFEAAINDFSTAIQLDALNMDAFVNRGTVYYYMNRLGDARKDLNRARNSGEQIGNTYNALALIAAEDDSLDLALQYIQTALSAEPMQPYFLNNRGYIHLLRGETDLSRADIDQSITLDPDNAWAYRNKARWYHSNGNYEEAIRLYLQALKKDTFIQKIHIFLGDSYHANGQQQEACRVWKQALEMGEAGAEQRLEENKCR
ncbi:tetratricopeptide repeat protein [Fulvivirga sedimenti]|uniref:Tetratricopeptide repeat protein n=1 Tax=Fulvivirga sedimenti TaxID=2879465 RepID=A0A9X1KYF3_9BACT|nr:tetratricopeptide repeat protein [Fulvivirga sedimenti]MCA6073546.1 tetratricopeptide repeat protein [Fulvivirga sedimenti]